MPGFDNDTLFCANVDFRGVDPVVPQITTDGQLLIGSTAIPNIKVGSLTSTGGTVIITPGSGTINLESGGAIPITFTEDAGTATSVLGNLNVFGTAGQGITTSGAGSTVTITASNAATAQKGVVALATNAETVTGTDTAKAVTADDLKAKLGVQTLHGVALGTSTTATVGWTAEPSNGQLLIGKTGDYPQLAGLTPGPGISITSGAGSITIASIGTGLAWSTKGASTALVNNNGFICTAGAALSFSLPAVSSVGDIVALTLDGSTSWTITQAANQQIRIGVLQTTVGVGGSLTSTAQGDTIIMVCSVANLKWNSFAPVGNITVV